MTDAFDWNDVAVRKLSDLWAEGHSTAEIGRRMGVSKNAVVGKAHRLDLPTRPSPVRRCGLPALTVPKLAPRRQRVSTLPSLASVPPPVPATTSNIIAPVPPRRTIARCDGSQCCWPIGEPGQPGLSFCDAPLTTRAVL
jgi:GcrA cell cycle regulator